MHAAAAGAGIGHQPTVPVRQLKIAGLGSHGGQPGRTVWRDSRRHPAAAQLRRGASDEPPEPDQFAAETV